MGKIQTSIDNTIKDIKKIQTNIGNVIKDIKKVQANIGGVIKDIWQGAFEFYNYGVEGVNWYPYDNGVLGENTRIIKKDTHLYINNENVGHLRFESDSFDISNYHKISFLYDAYLVKKVKAFCTLKLAIVEPGTGTSLRYSNTLGSVAGTIVNGNTYTFDVSSISGNVILEFSIDTGAYLDSEPTGWVKMYRVWGE